MTKNAFTFRLPSLMALTLFLALALFFRNVSVHAQASYLSIFGSSGCSNSAAFAAATSPPASAAFTAISSVNDPTASPATGPYPLANTIYNNTGQPIFSVDQNGIYKPNGSLAYDFTTGYTTSITSGGTTYTINAKQALSEVVAFPCQVISNNSSYYVVFWAYNDVGIDNTIVLRAIKVDIDASGNLTAFTENILYDATSAHGIVTAYNMAGTCPIVVADGAACGQSRTIYTIDETQDASTNYVSHLRQWTFGTDGSLPSTSTASYLDEQDFPTAAPVGRLFFFNDALCLGFISTGNFGTEIHLYSGCVALWKLSGFSGPPTNDIAAFSISSLHSNVYGFNLVYSTTGSPFVYISFSDNALSGSIGSGLGFFPATIGYGSSSSALTIIPSTSDFSYTDLLLDKGGDLLMAQGAQPSGGGAITGALSYLAKANFGSSSATPSVIAPSCTTSTSISVAGASYQAASAPIAANPFYLGYQYSNENPSFPVITGVDINTRCAPGSIGATAPVPQFSVTVTGGTGSYSYNWNPETTTGWIPGSSTFDSYTSATPNVLSVAPTNRINRLFTVTDNVGCASTPKRIFVNFITSGFDLASRDSYFDLYSEPNEQGLFNPSDWNIWQSPDIWNRYLHDGIINQTNESPEYAATGSPYNYLYLKIRNVGCTDYSQAVTNAKISAYWTMGGGAETWSTAWDGSTYISPFFCGGTHVLAGNQIPFIGIGCPYCIPDIPAGSNTIMSTSWIPPNPQSYYPPSCTPYGTYMELCFLSRIQDSHGLGLSSSCPPWDMTYCESTSGNISYNVQYNNNIATRNTSIATINALPAPPHHMVVISNGGLTSGTFSLQFANNFSLQPGTGISTLSNYVSIKVHLGPLFDIWQRAGGYGTYAAINADDQSVTFDGSNSIRLDSISLDSGAIYPLGIEFDLRKGVDATQIPNETVNFRQLYFTNTTNTLIDSAVVGTIDSSIVGTIDSTFDTTTSSIVYDTVFNTVYDTFYATVYDTVYTYDTVFSNYSWVTKYQPPPPPCPGVLTVTKLSNGPATKSKCHYGEILVSGCGNCSSPTVNVQGWIIDDNSGNFNLNGCSVFGGITQSHYRLSYEDVWKNVPVGSTIIMYNADNNCYNLPDSFTVSPGKGINGLKAGFGNIYWLPLGGTEANPLGKPHTERFKFALDTSICNYVVDTITTASDSTYDSSYYQIASDWQNTINFDPNGDAFQVRCPRCDRDMSKMPAFYHGFGYGPNSGTNQFASIPADANSLGGPVVNNTGQGYKYCFTGSSAADLGDPSQWQIYSADAEGTPPGDLGFVNVAFANAAKQNSLNLPCCAITCYHDDGRKTNNSGGGNNSTLTSKQPKALLQSLSVFPVPATMTLNFRYSLQDNITIRLTDVVGRLMDEQVLQNSTTASFNVANYAPGIYLYQVITDSSIQSGKAVVE